MCTVAPSMWSIANNNIQPIIITSTTTTIASSKPTHFPTTLNSSTKRTHKPNSSAFHFVKSKPITTVAVWCSSKSSGGEAEEEEEEEKEEVASTSPLSSTEDEWLGRLPDKKMPLYSHSLPCIEAWLRHLDFYQTHHDPAVWFIRKPDWHSQLSLDTTDLVIRYLKSGPGNLEKDVERRFSYALSREDIENAILGGP